MAEAQGSAEDRELMLRAMAAAARVRCITSPNPWVGCILRLADGTWVEGATREAGDAHAEIAAIGKAAGQATGATMYVTLEPCSHHGRTGPCSRAVIEAGISRVVIGIEDPDPNVSGTGIAELRDAGIEVEVGVLADKVAAQLTPYLVHRSTGRPWVVLKLAATLDGRTAAPDSSSQWITSPEARTDGHRLRAESDAIIVGAGTVREDDPSLTVRNWKPAELPRSGSVDPLRVVLGKAPPAAKVHPCLEFQGELTDLLDELGRRGVMQALVEGGAGIAGAFHRAGLIDRYVIYVAPALFGGDDARPLFRGAGAWTINDLWRGRFVAIERVGDDLRIELEGV